jgi:hypothetical protein
VAYSGRPSRSWCGDGSIDDGSDHRTIERDGERLWVLADVCEANDIGNPSQVASRLGADEKDALSIVDAMGRTQRVTVVNEAGLYKLGRPRTRRCFGFHSPAARYGALKRNRGPAATGAGDFYSQPCPPSLSLS